MKPSRRSSVAASVFAVLLASAACSSAGGAHARRLDGRSFVVSLVPEGQAPMKDDLIFADGVFESTVCTNAGFSKSAYSTHPVGGGTAFDVQCDSAEYGHNDWHGVVEGDHVAGTVVRTPKGGGAPVNSTFAGDAVR